MYVKPVLNWANVCSRTKLEVFGEANWFLIGRTFLREPFFVVSWTLHSPSPWRGSTTAAKIYYTAVTGDGHGHSLVRAQPPPRLEKELFVKQQVPCRVPGRGRGEGLSVAGWVWRECDRCDTMSSWTNTDGLHPACVPVVFLPSCHLSSVSRLPFPYPLPSSLSLRFRSKANQ